MSWSLQKGLELWEIREEAEVKEERAIAFLWKRPGRVPLDFKSLEDLETWLKEEEMKRVKRDALALLSARDYPSVLLEKKLAERGYSPKSVAEILEWLVRLDFVKDEAYLQAAVKRELRRGLGPRAIAWKLRAKGLSEEAISQEIRETATPEAQMEEIRKWIAKMRVGSDRLSQQKAMGKLLRRGFNASLIQDALRESPFSL